MYPTAMTTLHIKPHVDAHVANYSQVTATGAGEKYMNSKPHG